MKYYNITNRVGRVGFAGILVQIYYSIIYVFSKFILRKKYITRKIHDFRLRLDLNNQGLSRQLIISGSREEQLKAVLSNELTKGATILDLGANIGYYTAMMANIIGPTGVIYAIEPEPNNFKLLSYNVHLNGLDSMVSMYNVAAGETEGEAKFYISEYSNMHTMVPYTKYGEVSKGIHKDEFIMIDVVNPSAFLEKKKPVDIIRMDIEGFEVEVINGLESAIKEGVFSGKIIFEAHFPKYSDSHSIKNALFMLFDNGYSVTAVTSNDENTTFLKKRGYSPHMLYQTSDTRFQGLYGPISNDDAIYFLSEVGGVRDVVLSKTSRI